MSHRVLIVEDDPVTRAALVQLFQGQGYAADGVPDGRLALDSLRSGPAPRVILLDLTMPVMDGWEFLRVRQQDAALAAVPVVIFTAAAQVDGDGLRALGAETIVHKPADPAELLAAVGRYCGGPAG